MLPGVTRAPPPPPEELTEAQAETWRAIMAALPDGYIAPAAYPVLVILCRRVARVSALEQQAARLEGRTRTADLDRFGKLLRLIDHESKGVIAAARSLRLTPSALQHPRSAARAMRDNPQVFPWEDVGEFGNDDDDEVRTVME